MMDMEFCSQHGCQGRVRRAKKVQVNVLEGSTVIVEATTAYGLISGNLVKWFVIKLVLVIQASLVTRLELVVNWMIQEVDMQCSSASKQGLDLIHSN